MKDNSEGFMYDSTFSKVEDLFSEMTFQKCYDENVVLVCGDTGSGKSTLVNYMSGVKLRAVKPKFDWLDSLVLECRKEEIAVIGHSIESQTSVPKRYVHDQLVLWDCPGFEDNRSAVQDIVNAFGICKIRSKAENFKILVVVEEAALLAARSNDFRDVIMKLCKMFKENSALRDSVAICFTKCEEIENYKEYLLEWVSSSSYLNEFQESLIENIALKEKFVCIPKPTKKGKYSNRYKSKLLHLLDDLSFIESPDLVPVIADKYLKHVGYIAEDAEKDIKKQFESLFFSTIGTIDSGSKEDCVKLLTLLYNAKSNCKSFDDFKNEIKNLTDPSDDSLYSINRVNFIFDEILKNFSIIGAYKINVKSLLSESLSKFTHYLLQDFLPETDRDDFINKFESMDFILEALGDANLFEAEAQ